MRVVRGAAGPVAIAVATLLYTFGPLARMRTWFLSLQDDGTVEDDPGILAIYAIVALVALAVLATGDRWRRIPRPLAVAAGALTGWYLVSVLWSGDSGTTARHAVFIGAALLAGAGAAAAVSLRTLVWSAWAGMHVGLLWSVIAVRRNVNALDHNGDYAGVYFNRNSLALYAALGMLLSLIALADLVGSTRPGGERVPSNVWTVGMVAGLGALGADWYLLGGSDAATPMIALGVAVIAGLLAVLARLAVNRGVAARSVVLIGGGAMVVLGAVGWLARGGLFDLIGRRSNLTGRADLWDVAIEWAGRRPLQGYGYLGAWADEQFVREVHEASQHELFTAHNGFVEAYLGGGVIGLVAFTALLAVVFYGVAMTAVSNRSILAVSPFAVFMFVFVENLTETLIVANHLVVVLLAATAVAAARATARDERSDPVVTDADRRARPAMHEL